MRKAALGYAERGWSVFPLHGIVNGLCTCGRRECSSPGKHPLVRRGLYEATTDSSVIMEWWRSWRSANIGFATGAESGIVVIDVDLPTALESLAGLINAGIPRTLTALTGGGGVHLFFESNDAELSNSAGRLPGIDSDLRGLDLRANGGYVVGSPSTHASGLRYEWLSTAVPVAPAPSWLQQPRRQFVVPADVAPADFEGEGTAYGLAVLRDELDGLRASQVGTRNHQLNRSAFALAQLVAGGELLESAARAGLLMSAVAIGLDELEARQTVDSAFEAGLGRPRVAPHRRMS